MGGGNSRYTGSRDGDDRLAKKWDERQGGGDAFSENIDWSKPLPADDNLEGLVMCFAIFNECFIKDIYFQLTSVYMCDRQVPFLLVLNECILSTAIFSLLQTLESTLTSMKIFLLKLLVMMSLST